MRIFVDDDQGSQRISQKTIFREPSGFSEKSKGLFFFSKKKKRKIFDVFDGYKNYDLQGTSRERSKL